MDCQVALQPGLPPPPAADERSKSSPPDLVLVRVFRGPQSVMQADLARNILETEGIPCVVPGQYTAEMLPGIDAVQLFVSRSDAERSRELLESYFDIPQQGA